MDQVKKMSQFMQGHFGSAFQKNGRRGCRAIRVLLQPVKCNQGAFAALCRLPEDIGQDRNKKICIKNADYLGLALK